MTQLNRFMRNISQLESGGNPNARNTRTGAHGTFQIMPANWGPWSREAGIAGAPRTEENQRRVAEHKMRQYHQQFGSWDAVAVAWFAGPGRAKRFVEGDQRVLNLSDGNMTVGQYVNRINRGMGNSESGRPIADSGQGGLSGQFAGREAPQVSGGEMNQNRQTIPLFEDEPQEGEQESQRFRQMWVDALSNASKSTGEEHGQLTSSLEEVRPEADTEGLAREDPRFWQRVSEAGQRGDGSGALQRMFQGTHERRDAAQDVSVQLPDGVLGDSLQSDASSGVDLGGATGARAWNGEYQNGRIPESVMARVGGGGHRFHPQAAAAWSAMTKAAAQQGVNIGLTDSFRSYDSQVDVKRRKPHLAATPGHSNHGWGLAADVPGDEARTWIQQNGERFGWVHPTWARPGGSKPEPWHFEFEGVRL